MERKDLGSPLLTQRRLWSFFMPFVVGALYGLGLRLVFPLLDRSTSTAVMTLAFVALVPLAVGAITVYLAERTQPREVRFYIIAPWASIGLMLLGAALTYLEGAICIALAAPLFLLMSSIGGLIAGLLVRYFGDPVKTINSIAVLPLLVGVLELQNPPADGVHTVVRQVSINAPPEQIWQLINYPLSIKPEELSGAVAYKIGVPYPIEARTLSEQVGGKRRLLWQRGVSFEEEIIAWAPPKKIGWKYLFDAHSFPKGSMDEHVVIGGSYFDLVDTYYTLTPNGAHTDLEILVTYRVSTHFNWYTAPLAHFLISDTAKAILNFYKNRSEAH